MSYSKKIVVLIFFILTVAIFSLFYFLFSYDIQYREITFADIAVRVPAGFTTVDYDKESWSGKAGHPRSRSSWIYCLRRAESQRRPLESYLPKKHTYRAWMLTPEICFGVVVRGKAYRRYVYIFSFQDNIYWLESGSNSSSLIQVKEMADTLLTSLTVGGSPPIPDAPAVAAQANTLLPFTITQSFTFFILLTLGVMVFTYGIVWVISAVSSRAPKQYAETPHRVISGVTVKINLKPLGVQMQDGLVAICGHTLYIYWFGKQLAAINGSEFQDPARIKRGRTSILKQPYLAFGFPETTGISLPGRKRKIVTTKITLYMSGDWIDTVVREMGLPLYDHLSMS